MPLTIAVRDRRSRKIPAFATRGRGPMNRRYASSDWAGGRPARIPSALPTAFETRARELSLTAGNYASSQDLSRWCEDNRDSARYLSGYSRLGECSADDPL